MRLTPLACLLFLGFLLFRGWPGLQLAWASACLVVLERGLADAHQLKQLLAGIREVFAQMIVDRHPVAREFGFEDLRNQRPTTPARAGRAG